MSSAQLNPCWLMEVVHPTSRILGLTSLQKRWLFGPMAYSCIYTISYHIRGWYDVCNNMYIVRMNIHPTTIFCSPALRLPTLPWAQTAPAFAPRLVRADVWVRIMSMRFVKFTCMYFDSKKDQDTLIKKTHVQDMTFQSMCFYLACLALWFSSNCYGFYIYTQHIANCLFDGAWHVVVNCGHPLAEKSFLGDMTPPSRRRERFPLKLLRIFASAS